MILCQVSSADDSADQAGLKTALLTWSPPAAEAHWEGVSHVAEQGGAEAQCCRTAREDNSSHHSVSVYWAPVCPSTVTTTLCSTSPSLPLQPLL